MPKISKSWGKNGCFAENLTIFLAENAENLIILVQKWVLCRKSQKYGIISKYIFGTIFEM